MTFLVNPDSRSIRDFRNQAQHFSSERQDQISKASKALESIEPARIRRATLADYQTRVDEVLSGLAQKGSERYSTNRFFETRDFGDHRAAIWGLRRQHNDKAVYWVGIVTR